MVSAFFGWLVVVTVPAPGATQPKSQAGAHPNGGAGTQRTAQADAPSSGRSEPQRTAQADAPSSGRSEPPSETLPSEDDTADKAESRRHFERGIDLYEDKNYLAALAEFEAAYRQYPSASALQNVALCQKQLYRYSDARESLSRLVAEHADELSAPDRTSIEQAIAELGSLIGSVRLSVIPPSARVLLDGRLVAPEDLERSIALDVGEHVVTADAPGFAPTSRSFRIAGGHTDVPVMLKLTETTGTVLVTAPDAQTAIAIDGRAVAFAYWNGRLEPGRHIVQVYREGYEPFEEEIDVDVGATVRVNGVLGDRVEGAANGSGSAAPRPPHRGYYGLVTVDVLTPRGHPLGFDAASNYDLGWSLGIRAGYRLFQPLGLEGLVSSSSFTVEGHCTDLSPTACPTTTDTAYDLEARRFGAGVRLFSSHESLRLTSVFAAGAVSHDFHDASKKAVGLDPFVSLELGVQVNWRHTLWELTAMALFDGASSIHFGEYRPYAEANGIQMFGVGVRFGWGEWVPARAPLPPMPSPARPQ